MVYFATARAWKAKENGGEDWCGSGAHGGLARNGVECGSVVSGAEKFA